MKYIIVLLFAVPIKGQNWFQQYGNSKADYFTSITELASGGYVLVGNSNTLGNGKSDLWVICLDDTLSFVWQRFLGDSEDDFGKKIINYNNELYIFGETTNFGTKDIWILKLKLNGDLIWDQKFGDSLNDYGHSIRHINGRGFLIIGEKLTSNNSMQGMLILIDYNGKVIWKKIYGGQWADGLHYASSTLDGGIISIGYTNSFRNSGLKIPKSSIFKRIKRFFSGPKLSQEFWLLRLDSNGNKLWEKTYGGENIETGKFFIENGDSTLLIIGDTKSFGDTNGDTWLIKTNKNGREIWSKTHGGKGEETLINQYVLKNKNIILSIKSNSTDKFYETKNNNYYTKQILLNKEGSIERNLDFSLKSENVINEVMVDSKGRILNVGYNVSNKEESNKEISSKWEGFSETTINNSITKAWIFETDSITGLKINDYYYNGDRSERGMEFIMDDQLNITILGNENSYNDDNDICLVTFDYFGNQRSSVSFLEDGYQYSKAFHRRQKEGFVIVSETDISDYGGIDIQAKCISENGDIIWENKFGGLGDDIPFDAIGTDDNGSLIVSKTNSFGKGATDGWITKINESGNHEWSKIYGGKGYDMFTSIKSTKNGNYIITGSKSLGLNNEDVWLMLIDKNGDYKWQNTYGDNSSEIGIEVRELPTGDFIVVGKGYNSFNPTVNYIIMIKVDSSGNEIWSKKIEGSVSQLVESFCILNNYEDGYIIVGKEDKKEDSLSKIFLIHISSYGNIVWKKSFGESSRSGGCAIKDDGTGLVVMGNIDLDNNGNSDIFLLKTDYEGMIIKN